MKTDDFQPYQERHSTIRKIQLKALSITERLKDSTRHCDTRNGRHASGATDYYIIATTLM